MNSKMKAWALKISLLKGLVNKVNRLLKLEFRKLKKQKSFYICTAIMIALLFFSAAATQALFDASAEYAAQHAVSSIDFVVGAVSNCSFLLIAGIFTALFVCDDYEQQTIKNIYSKGYSRSRVYFSKFISVCLSVTVMFVLVVLCALLLGRRFFDAGGDAGYGWIGTVASQYAVCMANISLCFAISAALRKNGSAIAGIIVAPMLVNTVLGLGDSLLKSEEIKLTSLWISNFMNDLSTAAPDPHRLMVFLCASLVYIPLFVVIGAFFHNKTEL